MSEPITPGEDRVWRYKTWSASECTVVGRRVEFMPMHVVWYDNDGLVILAEDNQNVHELSEVGNGGSATRGVRGKR